MPKISWYVGLTSTERSRPLRACSGSTSVDFVRENNMVRVCLSARTWMARQVLNPLPAPDVPRCAGGRLRRVTDHLGFSTRAIHAGPEADPAYNAVTPPIYATSTYKQDGVGGTRGGYEYSRSGNPTRTVLEECLASLEGGRHGLAFASGLAAVDAVLRAFTGPDGHCVVPHDAYGGTYRLF